MSARLDPAARHPEGVAARHPEGVAALHPRGAAADERLDPLLPGDPGAMAPPSTAPGHLRRGHYAVFVDATDLPVLRVLKPGFRHCFVAINDGWHWLTLDPLAGHTELTVQPVPADYDLAGWYRGLGYTVVRTVPRPPVPRLAPPAPYTCVEAVKRTLGIRAWRVLTPWQLYRHLTEIQRAPAPQPVVPAPAPEEGPA